MILECIDNDGFEDQLHTGQEYEAITIKGGSVLLWCSRYEQRRWYGLQRFRFVL